MTDPNDEDYKAAHDWAVATLKAEWKAETGYDVEEHSLERGELMGMIRGYAFGRVSERKAMPMPLPLRDMSPEDLMEMSPETARSLMENVASDPTKLANAANLQRAVIRFGMKIQEALESMDPKVCLQYRRQVQSLADDLIILLGVTHTDLDNLDDQRRAIVLQMFLTLDNDDDEDDEDEVEPEPTPSGETVTA